MEEMLLKLYYVYQKSPKCLREWELSEAYKFLPKPTKCNRTSWIDYNTAVEFVYKNYGIFIAHLESLVWTNLQALKWAEVKGFTKKWKHTSYIVPTAIYVDIIIPLWRLAVAQQQQIHDQVKAVCHIQDFTRTLGKLESLIDESLDNPNRKLTHYKELLLQIQIRNNKKNSKC